MASDAEELSGSVADPDLLPSSASRSARQRADEELIRVMSNAVNELWLEWSLSEEPSHSRLDKCFFTGAPSGSLPTLVESFHIIARRDWTGSHTAFLDAVRV